MAADLVPSERDLLTGLPLTVLSTPEDLAYAYNYHHLQHPHRSPELSDLGGKAVRVTWGQDLPIWKHRRYHEIFAGPELPQDDFAKLRSAIFARIALPRQAIDLSVPNEYEVVTMTDEQYEFMSLHKAPRMEMSNDLRYSRSRRNKVGMFIAVYALKQNLTDQISQASINEFIHTTDPKRQKELGNEILRLAVEIAAEPLQAVHQVVVEEGIALFQRSPKSVMRKLFVKERFCDYYEPLKEKVKAVAEAA